MAPLPPNTTPTYFVDYTGPMGTRSFQFRTAASVTEVEAVNRLNTFLTALRPMIYASVTFTGVRRRAAGGTASFPVPGFTPVAGTAAGVLSAVNYPRYISFYGRTLVDPGRRLRFAIYGASFADEGDYRLEGADGGGAVGAAINALSVATAAGTFCAIDGNPVVWKVYVNVKDNDYFVGRARETESA